MIARVVDWLKSRGFRIEGSWQQPAFDAFRSKLWVDVPPDFAEGMGETRPRKNEGGVSTLSGAVGKPTICGVLLF